MKITVLGDGAMGTACAVLLSSKADNSITIWSAFPEQASEFEAARENTRFLPSIKLPDSIRFTGDIQAARDDCELVVAAIPTVYLRSTLSQLGRMFSESIPVVSVIKGLERNSMLRPTEIILECLGERSVAVLSGPSHAEEIARDLPASVVAASADSEFSILIQGQFSTPTFRVYTNDDVIGAELAGALKNVIGIAAGVCDGLGFGDNAKSAVMTRGIAEMTRFGVAMGAHERTFMGMAGIGDLITTCVSPHGRNRHVGELLGRGQTIEEIQKSMNSVAEGVTTVKAIQEVAESKQIEMPITAEVYRLIYEHKDPLQAVHDLMLRQPKSELG